MRRFYPFFPFVAARVIDDFDWRGYSVPAGTRTLLDLYGTENDPRLWDAPQEFRPERFRDWGGDPFTLIAQGGGDPAKGHRCPGEGITVELMKLAAGRLASMRYDVPPQDLRVSLPKMPALPKSGFVMRVRAAPARHAAHAA